MRLTIKFSSSEPVTLPLSYQQQVQGFIYNSISPRLAGLLHDYGFRHEKRSFKLFTFSRLRGAFTIQKQDKAIIFTGPLELHFSSPVEQFVKEFGNELLLKDTHNIGDNKLTVQEINVVPNPVSSRTAQIRMLSPITIYSTLSTADGRKKTYYYTPFENEFSELIRSNLIKKYTALNRKEPSKTTFQITPARVSKRNQVITNYKGFVIKGWEGIYEISGEPELLTLGLEAGFGGKNSQGFGCAEVV